RRLRIALEADSARRLGEGSRGAPRRTGRRTRQGAAPARVPRVCRTRCGACGTEGGRDEPHRCTEALRARGLSHRPALRDLAETPLTMSAATVSLLRWLRRQLREPTPDRERLEAAIANDDPQEARRIVARVPFSDAQRHHVESMLDAWE